MYKVSTLFMRSLVQIFRHKKFAIVLFDRSIPKFIFKNMNYTLMNFSAKRLCLDPMCLKRYFSKTSLNERLLPGTKRQNKHVTSNKIDVKINLSM